MRQTGLPAVLETVPYCAELAVAQLPLYHCQPEIVINDRFGGVLCGAHNPCASESLTKCVKCLDFPVSKKFLQTLLAHGNWQTLDFLSFAGELLSFLWLQKRQDLIEITRIHSNTKS